MRRLVLLFASALVLTGCGGSSERLASFICENIPNEDQTWEADTLDDYQKKLDSAESLAEFHKEELPWVYERETGDLYEYDDFEDAFVPLTDFDISGDDGYFQRWQEYSSKLSKDGKKLRLKITEKSKSLLGERIEYVTLEIYDIETNTVVQKPDEGDERTAKCMDVPTAGIDVQWAEGK